jgi:FAD/FMN-containing dehydrogenase
MVGTLIKQARTKGRTIGSPSADFQWDFSHLDEVVSFNAQDMVITAETGLTLNKVKALTEAEKLWLPLDSPQGGDLLLSEYLAQDLSLSWLCHRHGTLRDWVMGLTTVNDMGQEVNSGARVVKNVAGYQLAPLYIGARMALGPILEVSFRLLPMPTSLTFVRWQAASPSPLMAACRQIAQQCYPSGRGDPWEGLCITRANGQWRMDGLTRFQSDKVKDWTRQVDGVERETLTEMEVPPRENRADYFRPALLLQVLPTQISGLLDSLNTLNMDLVCYPGAGAILLRATPPSESDSLWRDIFDLAVAKGGSAQTMTTEVKIDIPPIAMIYSERRIMERIKSILDPEGVFGPLPEVP